MHDENLAAVPCPRCGSATTDGVCRPCLLLAAVGSLTRSTIDDAPTHAPDGPTGTNALPLLNAGDTFGPYRIERLLGRGGMGEVYEAEHSESGRRVALKILRGRLRHAEDKARFAREGQLAASISHPHAVYIFGSEEIDGQPVITMELLPGGTLADRVLAEGPMPVHTAVAAVLDIIGGLDAAQAAGILHRDIKPSNCFTDSDGTVKVGDFGLSISTLARDVRHEVDGGGFQGTPQFASPEQLRGEPLDLRSDIYAVGATLFYLLTGRPPYQAEMFRDLVSQILETPVPSPRSFRREMPAELARVIQSCLAKETDGRPSTYAQLAARLRPFTRPLYQPAPPGQRFIAGAVDLLILSSLNLVLPSFGAWFGGDITIETSQGRTSVSADYTTWVLSLFYFGALEGLGGASLGKRLFGLRVTADGRPAPTRAMLTRIAVYHAPGLTFLLPALIAGRAPAIDYLSSNPGVATALSVLTMALMAGMFLTARRRNGWAGLHDLASGLRVVTSAASQLSRSRLAVSHSEGSRQTIWGVTCGPFDVVADLGQAPGGRLLAGVDPVLRRKVWIFTVAPGTPGVAPARRDVSRPDRLHWLAGRRTSADNWDAFEAPEGMPWSEASQQPVPWSTTRTWLRDLARELVLAEQEGTMPCLSISRLWIRPDGHLILLDHPAPGQPSLADTVRDPVELLLAVAEPAVIAAERGDVLPLTARRMIEGWRCLPATPVTGLAASIEAACASPVLVARWRRALPIGLAALPTVAALVATLLSLPALRAFVTAPHMEMLALLDALANPSAPDQRLAQAEVRESIERYLASVHRDTLTAPAFWANPAVRGELRRLRPLATEIADRRPAESADAVHALRILIAPELDEADRRLREVILPGVARVAVDIAAVLGTLLMAVMFSSSLVSAAVVPGGMVTRQLGLAVVTRSGQEVSRLRSVLRTAVAWLPAMAWTAWVARSPVSAITATPGWAFAVIATMSIGAIITVISPARGLHDLATGCRVTPR